MYPASNDDQINTEIAAELLRRLAGYAEREAERLLGMDKNAFSQRIKLALEDQFWANRLAEIYDKIPSKYR